MARWDKLIGPAARILPLEACAPSGATACKLMSKMYPGQAPTCSAHREANGRLVETCGLPAFSAPSDFVAFSAIAITETSLEGRFKRGCTATD